MTLQLKFWNKTEKPKSFYELFYFPVNFGPEWSTAVINSRQEYYDILEGYLNYSGPMGNPWIDGSTGPNYEEFEVTFDNYLPDRTGIFVEVFESELNCFAMLCTSNETGQPSSNSK